MNFEELQNGWKSQQEDIKLKIDPDVLVSVVKRNHENFKCTIFWRDVREAGISLVMFGFFLYFGIKDNSWTSYLLSAMCLWVSLFLIIERYLQKQRQPCLADSLSGYVNSSIYEVNHQIWLLKNVLWWYLAPLSGGLLISFAYSRFWNGIIFVFLMTVGIYWLNQWAVRKELLPRKLELEELLENLKD